MLTLENVTAGYDATHALSEVSLNVQEGEVVCLVGRNGAGKSSLLRSIVQDQIKVRSGRIQFRETDLVGLKPYSITRQGIALVPEDRRVFPTLTVRDNLLVPKQPRGRRSTRWSIGEVYRLFPPLKEFSTRPAGVLSGGEQQMLSIGRSLLTNPELLLLDEPNEGLAPIIVDSVVAAIRALSKEGMSMLVSEQSLHLVHECADRMYVIDRGSLVFEGTVEAFKANPAIAERHLMVM